MGRTDFESTSSNLRLLKLALRDPAAIIDLEKSDIDLLVRLARRCRLHGRIAANLKAVDCFEHLAEEARDQLQSAFVMAQARERVAKWELDRIQWALQGVPARTIVCLKGAAYILLGLPNVPGRIFADVDLLVAEDLLEETEQALNDRGWVTQQLTPYDDNYYRRWTHELPPLVHRDRDVEIDLHHNILPRTARLSPPAASILQHAVPIADSCFSVPMDTDIVIHAITHLMFDSAMDDGLRDLVDVDDLLQAFSGRSDDFWDRLVERAVELDLTRPTYYGLRYANVILGSNVPHHILQKTSDWAPMGPIRRLMDTLVPRALLPPHPDQPQAVINLCRLFLYMRSHWIRMPPWLLAYHLTVKFVRKQLGPRS